MFVGGNVIHAARMRWNHQPSWSRCNGLCHGRGTQHSSSPAGRFN
jgi:hypothetical protein